MTDSAGPSRRRLFLQRVAAGEHVFREGDGGTEMYIVHRGVVEIVDESETPPRLVARMEKGDFFGEMSLLEDLPRLASAVAVEDSQLVRVDRATFDRMLREDPEIAVRIMRKLSRRLRRSERRLRQNEREEETSGAVGEGAPTDARAAAPSPGRLLHPPTGTVYELVAGESLIGRSDPVTGIRPAVDLSGVDPERSCSRRHAKIFEQEGSLFLVEDIGTTNGTFVEGEQVRSGVPVRLEPGNRIRFGLVDLELQAG